MTVKSIKIFSIILLVILWFTSSIFGQHNGHNHDHVVDGSHHEETTGHCGFLLHEDKFDPTSTALHHISDQNVFSIGPWQFPLPCILYVPEEGLKFFSSGKFGADGHGNGHYAYEGFVLYHGSARRVVDPGFPRKKTDIGHHNIFSVEEEVGGKKKDRIYLCYNNERYLCDSKSIMDGGFLGGGLSSFYDFSITKNVMTMILVALLLGWIFITVSKRYQLGEGKAPRGIQSFMEPLFIFVQDNITKPFFRERYLKFQPFLMALFFFILGLNLIGQIPFMGNANVTGNLAVTMALAVLTFIITNFNGNRHYWKHIFNMPGVPILIKLILTPVEIISLFIKPLTLMMRLFGNITAGHIVMVVFVGLIFIFGQNGQKPMAGSFTVIGSALLTMFMMAIELLVAFIQAFIFTILTASYIGSATEEHHDDHH